FEPACRGLKAAGLLEPPSRLVLEKPIGHDLASAREINATLRAALDESRIFRIDHYLGKAPVQNLLPLRCGNTLLEAVWDNQIGFEPACRGLKAAGLLEPPSRLVLEKPIGHDLASAREINATLRAALDESRIFRIDHYLGKAPVQNLLPLRFGNTLLEAVWDNRCIESVDIVVAETAGVDGREGYYADYGALRDMVQNHMLQLLALVAMEPPAALDADSIRDEKRKVLRALRPMTAADAASDSIRGRYGPGVVEGRAAQGFK